MIYIIIAVVILTLGGVFVYNVYKPLAKPTPFIIEERKAVEDYLDCLVTNIRTKA